MRRVCRSQKRTCWALIIGGALVAPFGASVGVAGPPGPSQRAAPPGQPIATQTLAVSHDEEDFRPLTPEQVERSRQTLVAATGQLDRFLSHGTPENSAAWKQYLKWGELQSQISAESEPDGRVLGEILAKYYSGASGLERPPFVDLREALLGYRRQTLARGDDDFAQLYRNQLAAIEKDLQSGVAGSGGPLADLAARLEWLEQLNQAPQLVADVRQQFGHPNLLVSASGHTIGTGFEESVSETTEVNDMILGTHVCGTAHTQAAVTATLVPNDKMAVIELTLRGVATSQTVGRQKPVRIYSQGVTQLFTKKRLLIDGSGVRDEPATACCSTDNHICRIRSDSAFASNLIQKVAWKRARQQERTAERIASRHAERRLADRMDERTRQRLAESNTNLNEKVRRPFRERNIYPRSLRIWTTRDRLRMTAFQGRRNQLTAPSDPPVVSPCHVLAQVHESMLLNTAVNAIGGMTVTDERAQELVKEITGEVPEELRIKQDEDPWAITFDLQRPLRIEFDDDKVVIAIRGRRFLRGEQEVRQMTQIAATYQLSINNGRAQLRRIGDIEVSYPDNDSERLSLTELRNKTFLTSKFEGLFKKEFGGEGIQLTDQWAKLRDMALEHISTKDGWLTLGWN